MAYDPDVHDITLNGQDFRVLARQRDSAPEFVAKFNTGSQGENDLDIFKSKSTNSFAGGQFQTRWDEDERVATITNGYYNEVDGVLYPTPQGPSTGIAAPSGLGKIRQLVPFNTELLTIADNATNTGGQYTKTDKSQNTITTVPAAMSGTTNTKSASIVNLAGGATEVWMTGKTNVINDVFSWAGTSATITTQDTTEFLLLAMVRTVIYAIKSGGVLYYWDEPASAWKASGKRIGQNVPIPLDMFDFNNRLWVARTDGLYQWDGVEPVKVLDWTKNNAKMSTWQHAILFGWLYYMLDGFLYRFNGGTVEKLRDFRGVDIGCIFAGQDRLWVGQNGASTWINGKQPYSDGTFYLHCFDQVGWFTWKEWTYSDVNITGGVYWNGNLVIAQSHTTPTSTGHFEIYELADEFTDHDADTMTVELSEFDANFPNIDKYLKRIEVDHEALDAGDTIGVYVRTYDGTAWSAYTDLGDITTLTNNFIDLADQGLDGNFKSVQIKIDLVKASGSESGIRDVSFRYVIAPEIRWRWSITVTTNNEELDDNATSPNIYRKAIEDALESNSPVDMLDVHWTILAEALDASETDITVDDASIFKINDLMLVESEKMRVTGIDTGTNILTVVRGARNTTAATHAVDTKCYVNQEVYVTRLINEVLTPRGPQDRGGTSGTMYDSTMQLEIVEA